MKFTPKSEREIAEEGLIPGGTICDFEVIEAVDTVSKAGNEMIALKLKVWRPNGGTTILRAWLVSTLQRKVYDFAKATGQVEAYEAGTMDAAALVGACGKVKVKVEPENNGYPAQNGVAFYVAGEAQPQRREPSTSAPVSKPAPRGGGAALDDDIPFVAEWR